MPSTIQQKGIFATSSALQKDCGTLIGMKKTSHDQPVTQGEFEPAMNAIKQEFNRIDDRFKEVDERFDEVDHRLDRLTVAVVETNKQVQKIVKVTEATWNVVQSIDQNVKELNQHRLPERVQKLEEDMIKVISHL